MMQMLLCLLESMPRKPRKPANCLESMQQKPVKSLQTALKKSRGFNSTRICKLLASFPGGSTGRLILEVFSSPEPLELLKSMWQKPVKSL